MSVELQYRIVLRHRSGEGYQRMFAALKFPKNTVASIILKWNKFGTTKTIPRAVLLAELKNRGRRVLVREVTKNPIVRSEGALEFLCVDGGTFQKDNHLCSTPPSKPIWYWSDGSHSSVKGT